MSYHHNVSVKPHFHWSVITVAEMIKSFYHLLRWKWSRSSCKQFIFVKAHHLRNIILVFGLTNLRTRYLLLCSLWGGLTWSILALKTWVGWEITCHVTKNKHSKGMNSRFKSLFWSIQKFGFHATFLST